MGLLIYDFLLSQTPQGKTSQVDLSEASYPFDHLQLTRMYERCFSAMVGLFTFSDSLFRIFTILPPVSRISERLVNPNFDVL